MFANQFCFFLHVAEQPELKTSRKQFNLIAAEESILININAVNKGSTEPDGG